MEKINATPTLVPQADIYTKAEAEQCQHRHITILTLQRKNYNVWNDVRVKCSSFCLIFLLPLLVNTQSMNFVVYLPIQSNYFSTISTITAWGGLNMITTIFIIKVILLILHLPQQQVYQSPGVKQEAAYEMAVRWFSLYHVHSKVLDFLSITVWPAYILDFMQYANCSKTWKSLNKLKISNYFCVVHLLTTKSYILMKLCCIRKVWGHPKNKPWKLLLSSLTCTDGTTRASLCEGCPRRCVSNRVCVRVPLLSCRVYMGQPPGELQKALVKWAAGHHSWPENTQRGKRRATR